MSDTRTRLTGEAWTLAKNSLKFVARLNGCTCEPDITQDVNSGTGVYCAVVAHDSWCEHRTDEPAHLDSLRAAVLSLGPKS